LKIDKIPFSIKQLAEKRLKARLKKDFRTADKIRKLIKAKGFELEDTIKSYILRKK
jgi:cysteinyl-tRNA synthetase